jgi:hypothetical protein
MVYRDHRDGDPSVSAYSTGEKMNKALLEIMEEFEDEIKSPGFKRAVKSKNLKTVLRLWMEYQDSCGLSADYLDLRKCELDA